MASEGNFISEYIVPMFQKGSIGVCIDIGAYDPIWINNSIELENLGWRCYCIEPNPHCIPALKSVRKNVLEYAIGATNKDNVDFYINYVDPLPHHSRHLGEAGYTGINKIPTSQAGVVTVEKVKLRTFEWVMENEIKEEHVDVISIDVEGNEMDVLATLDVSRWLPKVVICENSNNNIEQHNWFEMMGFGKIKRHCDNDIYVRLSEIRLRVGK